MTFLHKLARRLAAIHRMVVPVLFVFAACQTPEDRDFLSPIPPSQINPATVVISPDVASVKPGETVQFGATARTASGAVVTTDFDWFATGGVIEPNGTFRADARGVYSVEVRVRSAPHISDIASVSVYGSPTDIVYLVVDPDSTELGEGEGVQLTAVARQADGKTATDAPLEWSATGGEVDGGGWFTAQLEGAYLVSVQANADINASAVVMVKRRDRIMKGISVTPETATLAAGGTVQFSAQAVYTDGWTQSVSVSWSTTGGTITGNGTFTAGSTPGNFRIIGRYKNGAFVDTAYVSITEPTILSLEVNPSGVTLVPSGNQLYEAKARFSDGSTRTVGASWRATGGIINASGLYTAGSVGGDYRVIGSVGGTSLADTAMVTVSPAVTLTGMILNPSSVTIPAGGTRQFSVTGTYSDGIPRTPLVNWSATGGTMATGGLYTAGSVPGNYRVIATEPETGKADTSSVTVTESTLVELTLTPAFAELTSGVSLQFDVSGRWSDGGTTEPSVTFSATSGTITPQGLYTSLAGSTGPQQITATHSASGLADTAVVTLVQPAPTLNTLAVSPQTVSLRPATTRQMSVVGTWSDGTQGLPQVTWSATGGTVSPAGLYTAPGSDGSYRIIARYSSSLADTADVTVSAAAAVLTDLTISPTSTSVQTTGSRQFTVSGTWSDGSTMTPQVTWSATGGTMTGSGLYVAGTTAGTYQVTASAQGSSLTATATVSVTAAPVVTGVTVQPGIASLTTGQTQQFTVSSTYSNGSTGTPSVTWSSTGGSIAPSGLYTAGSQAGTFIVVALCTCGFADTSLVSVASASSPISGLTITPSHVALQPGEQATFRADGWVTGSSTPVVPSVTWSSAGGGLQSSGAVATYTAGSNPGTYWVKSQSSVSSHWDSATVTIGGAATLTRIEIVPTSLWLSVNESRDVAIEGVYSDGTRHSVAGSFRPATCGSVTSSSPWQFVAGSSPGECTLTADFNSLIATAPVVVSSGQVDPRYPNKPAALVTFAEQSFASLTMSQGTLSGQWTHHNILTNLSAVSDAGARSSAPQTVATKYPIGLPGGDNPARISGWDYVDFAKSKRFKELYVSMWMKIPGADFQNQSVGTKLWYVGYGNTTHYNDGFLLLKGNGSTSVMSKMALKMYISETDDRDGPSYGWDQNVNTQPLITAGAWHHIEVYMHHGTVNTRNGILRVWVNGQKVMEYTNMKYLDSRNAFTQGYFAWTWAPVWGGTGGVRTREDKIMLDHVLLAGRQ